MSFEAVYESLRSFRDRWKYFDLLGKKDFLYQLIHEVILKDGEIELQLFFLPPTTFNAAKEGGQNL